MVEGKGCKGIALAGIEQLVGYTLKSSAATLVSKSPAMGIFKLLKVEEFPLAWGASPESSGRPASRKILSEAPRTNHM
jgi:hypothetical protein